jgi:hypothetical protein
MRRLSEILVVALAAVAVLPAVVSAQYAPTSRPERPYHGLFGGGYGSSDQLLSLGLTFSGGRDTDVLRGTFAPTDGETAALTPQRTGSDFGQFSGTLSYSLTHKRLGVNAFGSGSSLYYPTAPQRLTSYYNAGAGMNVRLGTTGSLAFGEAVSYQPFYFLSPFSSLGDGGAGLPFLPDIGSSVQSTNYWQNSANVALSVNLTKRLTFQTGYWNQMATSAEHDRDLNAQSVGAHFGYGLTEHLSLVLGYTRSEYTSRDLGVTQHTVGDGIDGGLNYGRSLSLTRKLSFNFNTGVAGLRDRSGSHYTGVGHAGLVREIGRSWSASLAYDRSLTFIAAFQQPVQSDSVSGGVGGLITKRVQLASSVGYTRGIVGFNTTNNGFASEFASVSLTFGLSQTLGLGGQYTYYRSHFGAGITLPNGLFNQADRQTVRVYLSVWVPLLSTKVRPHAAR